MKKLLTIACACAACAALADTEITCGNTIGTLAISSTNADTIVAVPFGELATDGDICASNIVKTANLTKGDSLYVYDAANKNWTAWVLDESAASTKHLYWKSVGTATFDKDGNLSVDNTPPANETYLVAGSAIWLKRQNPTKDDEAIPFYVYGRYVQALSTPVTAGKYNLIANPLAAAAAIPGAVAGDKVKLVYSETSTRIYHRNNAGLWAYQKDDGTWSAPEALELDPGQGAWYCPKSGSGIASVTWRN